MYLIKRLTLLVIFSIFVFASDSVFADGKFGYHPADVKKALLRGEIEEALTYYESTAREAEKKALATGSSRDWSTAASAYRAASKAARFSGRLQEALTAGHKALETAQKAERPHFRQLNASQELAYAYRSVGEYGKAMDIVGRAFEHLKNAPEVNYKRRAAILYTLLGEIFIDAKQYRKAIPPLKRSLSLHEGVLLELGRSLTLDPVRTKRRIYSSRDNYILALRLLGLSHQALGQPAAAMNYYQDALRMMSKWKLKSHQDRRLYDAIAKVYLDQKNYSKALTYLKKAKLLDEKRRRMDFLVSSSQQIGDLFYKTGRPSEAILYYRQSIRIIESTRSLLESDYRRSYFEQKLDPYTGIVLSLEKLGRWKEAFNYNERARSREFLDLLGNRVNLARDVSLLETAQALDSRISSVKAKLARGMVRSGLEMELASAEQAYNGFLNKVRNEDEEQASLISVEPLTLEEVQGLLDSHITLIEYLVTDSSISIWVVERDKLENQQVNLPRGELTRLVKALRERISRLEEVDKVKEASASLYQILVHPIVRRITGKELIIVPHGILHYLPFQALISPIGRYLIEDYSIHYLTSASLMKFTTAKRRVPRGRKVLAIGNPDSGQSQASLKFAELEVEEAKNLYPGSQILLRNRATKETVKIESAKHDILHFAAHAELSKDDPLSSAILLAKDGSDDGKLTVKEIFKMNLSADLVVLSGCETGLGKISRGDEMVSLTRAFIYAGTPSVIASLWKVADRSTAALMGRFYRNLKNMSKAEALRMAQLQLIREEVGGQLLAMRGVGGITNSGQVATAETPSLGSVVVSTSHPYFWAPFVLIGDGK